MTDKLKEQIAAKIANWASGDEGLWEELKQENNQMQLDVWLEAANEILALLKEFKLVELADDQRTPEVPDSMEEHAFAYLAGQGDLLEKGWRKVVKVKSE